MVCMVDSCGLVLWSGSFIKNDMGGGVQVKIYPYIQGVCVGGGGKVSAMLKVGGGGGYKIF